MTVTAEDQKTIDAITRLKFAAFAERAFKIIEPGTSYEYNWHIGCIAEHLEAAFSGELLRLIINIPPRTLKTTLVSVLFPAWVFGRKPESRFVNTSFKFERVESMSLKCRHILNDAWYQHCFPDTRLDPAQGQKHNFHTTAKGQYYSSAILSVTGEGGDYVMCDDPLNPDEALSETIRNATNATIRGTLFSRFNDPRTGRFILTMQRLHEDDPTGNLMKDGGYHVLKLPAEAKRPVKITLGAKTWAMEDGQLLFPTRLSREILDQKRIEMTEYNYAGQYLQEPIPIGGGEFKPEWVQYYLSGAIRPKTMNIVILVDAAAGEEINKKKKKTSDWTAMMVVGLAPDNNYYLLDIVRDRLNPTERIDALFTLHRKWNALSGKPPKVGYEKYGLMTDTFYITDKQNKDGYRFPLFELGGSTPKEVRIRRLIPDMQQLRWWLPANLMYTDTEGRAFDLVAELTKSEMPVFPRARFDDMLDALSRVYDKELCMVFPQAKTSLKQNIIDEAYELSDETDWTEF